MWGMDRGAKRKASLATSPSQDARSSKRQRTPDPLSVSQYGGTSNAVRDVGLRFTNQLRNARDKSGKLIAIEFLSLPSPADYPDYYEQIALPLAIDTIEEKLETGQYPDISSIEGDVKRMIQNAKEFNESGSDVFLNAERIRKMLHNFMSKNNPAHNDPNYQPKPTPIPGGEQNRVRPVRSDVNLNQRLQDRATPGSQVRRSISASVTNPDAVLNPDEEGYDPSFAGKTFQQAQEQLVLEMMRHKEDDGLEIFTPFVTLPPRNLADYYRIIKEPTSLKSVLKKVNGIHGRYENTGTTDFRSWDAFEAGVRKIWENAREYNEDGSDMYNLAGELEEFFAERLEEAKQAVAEPAQPTLRLNMSKPAPIKLRLGQQQRQSPSPSTQADSSTPGVNVDQSALQRQKQIVQAGVNSDSNSPAINAMAATEHLRNAQSPNRRGSLASPALPVNGIKTEPHRSQSPAVANPNSVAPGPAFPPGATYQPVNGVPVPLQQPSTYTPYIPPPATGFDSKWRPDGKGVSDALLTNLSVESHPSLALPNPFHIDIPPHETLSQQSVTLNLPSSHYMLQLHPSLSASLTTSTPNTPARPYRLFVTINGQRVSPSLSGKGLFDVKLSQGVNRIEVECVAVAAGALGVQGIGKGGNGLEMEKNSVFVHLLRQ